MKARKTVADNNGSNLYLSLMMDEMSIMARLEYDPSQQEFTGEVNLGGVEVKDNGVLATQGLVLMVVAMNESLKLPIAHFYIHGLDGDERASIVNLALAK